MPVLFLSATRNTPEVYLNTDEEAFRIHGISNSLRSVDFFESIIDWLAQNASSIPAECTIEFKLPHFNSSSVKALIRLVSFLKNAEKTHWKVRWIVEADDEFMLESAENLQEATEMNFEIIHV